MSTAVPSQSLHYTAGHPATDVDPTATSASTATSTDPLTSETKDHQSSATDGHRQYAPQTRFTSSHATSSPQQPRQPLDSATGDNNGTNVIGSSSSSASVSAADLPSLKKTLYSHLRQFPDFPKPGILFEDILPLFSSPSLHNTLITSLTLLIETKFSIDNRPDIIVGLEARGFLFAPTLALKLGAGFVPARKPGKLPGQTVEAAFKKEYGRDAFQVQEGAIRDGQKVLVVDDILATGGSAAAAGELVEKSGGVLLGFVFLLVLDFLNGKSKLAAPVHTLLDTTTSKDSTDS